VNGRVKAGSLRLREAWELLELSSRPAKRMWARYRKRGAKALQHGNCGRGSHRAHAKEFRQAVLRQVSDRYADFGPRRAAEHLGEETDSACTPRCCDVGWGRPGCGGERGDASPIGSGGNEKRILAWCSSTAAFMSGGKSAASVVV
jgi:hypothetical protein